VKRDNPYWDSETFALAGAAAAALAEQGDFVRGQRDPRTKRQAQPELAPITARHYRHAPRRNGEPHAGQEAMYA
jgi:hypothetical protein